MHKSVINSLFLALCAFYSSSLLQADTRQVWSEPELALLKLQWIESLPQLSPDPSNRYADNPGAARLGQRLFFDKRLSLNGKVSCATCHVPENTFTDSFTKGRGVGEASRNTPNILGVAYSPWFFWDGRSDSMWSQALGPLESSVEHGGSRMQYVRLISSDTTYRKTYEELFGPLPDLSDIKRFPQGASPVLSHASRKKWQAMAEPDRKAISRIFANMGKAIAAYERLLVPGPSRFDRYVEALLRGDPAGGGKLSSDEAAGLKLFIGKAMCATCHQGPLFTNHGFHNVGAPDPAAQKPWYIPSIVYLFIDKPVIDKGRFHGVRQAINSEFNCMGEYSDASKEDCAELRFVNKSHAATLGAFKVPSLRNIAKTAPYMHNGELKSLREVLAHYNTAPKAARGHSELAPLGLTDSELAQLEAFLGSLDSQPRVDRKLLQAPASR